MNNNKSNFILESEEGWQWENIFDFLFYCKKTDTPHKYPIKLVDISRGHSTDRIISWGLSVNETEMFILLHIPGFPLKIADAFLCTWLNFSKYSKEH